jgi:hypothetical protein
MPPVEVILHRLQDQEPAHAVDDVIGPRDISRGQVI